MARTDTSAQRQASRRDLRLAIEYRSPRELSVSPNNARAHTPEQIEHVAGAIRQFGFINPIVLKGNDEIAAGHARHAAAVLLGLETVPTIRADHLSESELRAYMLADNRLAELARWDNKILASELAALSATDLGFNVELTGFSLDDIAELTASSSFGRTDPDAAPELEATAISRRGDLWILGSHHLLCGDSTAKQDVDRLFDGLVPNLMVTDPPYGVNYDPAWRESADLGVGKRSTGKVSNDDRVDWTPAWRLFPGNVAYCWHAGVYTAAVANSLEAAGFAMRSTIIWVKQHFVMSRGDYHWQHEPCWYAVRKGSKSNWRGDRAQTTTWAIRNNNSFGNQAHEETWGHGTQKPVACMLRPILNNSRKGEVVYDPFVGSGTTIIACEQEGRRCLAMEIDPRYADVAIRRWQAFTGQQARRHDGKLFSALTAGSTDSAPASSGARRHRRPAGSRRQAEAAPRA